MKLDNLKARRPTSAGRSKPWTGPAPAAAGRPRDWRQELATLRFPITAYARAWDLTDEECESVLNCPDNLELARRGGTVSKSDMSDWYVVKWVGWQLLQRGWSIAPQDRPGTGGYEYGDTDTDQRRPAKVPYLRNADKWGHKKKTSFVAFLPTQWREQRMSMRQFIAVSEHMFAANIAIQCCAASGHIRALDIDCTDPALAARIRELAVQHLGPTPFIRVGNAPKVQMLYRVAGADIDIKKWSLSIDFGGGEEADHQAIEFLAEGALLTSYGLHHKTMLSFDWSQGSLHPAIAGPEAAPLVTQAMLRAFSNAVAQEFKVEGTAVTSNPYGAKATASEFDMQKVGSRTFRTPRRITGDWTMNAEGHVLTNAEKWLTAQVWALCSANALNLDLVYGYLVEWLQYEACWRLLNSPRDNAALSTKASIERQCKQRMKVAADKFRASLDHHRRTGDYHNGVVPWLIGEDGRRPFAQRVRRADRPADGSLDWIPDDVCVVPELAERQGSKVAVATKDTAQVEADKAARALVPTREERKRAGNQASARTLAHIGDWLATVPKWNPTAGPVAPWVLRGPTGVGKTVGMVKKLTDFGKARPRRPGDGPILFLVPTHANADEAVEKAIDAGMATPDMWTEKDLEDLERKMGEQGVKIARLQGRRHFCERLDEMQMLTSRGIGASGLCEAKVDVVGDGEDAKPATTLDRKMAKKDKQKLAQQKILCPFRERGECGYYNQMSDLASADIIVLPHAYAHITALPKEIRNARAVIVDEGITYSLLGQTRMPLSTLRQARHEPYVTKLDHKVFVDACTDDEGKPATKPWPDADIVQHYITGRDDACSYALEWLGKDLDVAVEFGKLENGPDLIARSITVCERANDRARFVRPDLTPSQVAKIADQASGRYLLEEIRWWKTVRDRMERIAAGTAKGKRDMRWQLVQHPETVGEGDEARAELTWHLRLSWRKSPNWLGAPTLLLDASANPRIIGKLFGAHREAARDRARMLRRLYESADDPNELALKAVEDAEAAVARLEPVVRTVEAQQHGRAIAMIERTWSNSSFIPPWDATDDEIRKAAGTIEQARRLITTIAVIYGHGRVLVGSTIAVREVINGGGWVPPPNVDFVHYGDLRGRDFAKGHVAAISFGRSEQPIGVIDGYRAALTFDDDDPEGPYDALGTGLTAEGKPLFRPANWSRIEMRTGEDVDHMVPSMPARPVLDARGRQVLEGNKLKTTRSWGQDLEESWREEEIRQFLGRLRLVYRSIDDDAPPPVWISVGKIIPAGVIVDEIVEMGSVLKAWPMAELVRLGGGVLSENVTPSLPGAQAILEGRSLKELAQSLPKGTAFIKRWAAPFAHARYRLHGSDVDRSAMLLPGWYEGGDIQDHWMGLSERYGLLPDVQRVSTPRLHSGAARRKPVDKRDVDRDWQLESEIWVRAAKPADVGGTEFLIRHARGEYEVEDPDPPAE